MIWKNVRKTSYHLYFGIVSILLLILFKADIRAQHSAVEFSPKLQKAYFEIQRLRINTARQLIDAERSAQNSNAFIPYLDNYADLHYLLISEDVNAYRQLSSQQDKRLELIGKLPDSSPYKRFFQAEIRMHWAFAKLKFGNEISGSWEIIKAYRLLEDNRKRFPQFLPTLKSLGLLHVLIGSIPDHYNWVTKVLGLKGNIKLGIKEIQAVANTQSLFQQEAELIDLLLHAYTLKLSAAQQSKIRAWPREQPDNLLIHFFATTVLMKEGNGEEAAHYLADAPSGPAYILFPFLHYLQGEIELQKGEYENASAEYILFQKQYRGFNYLKDSNLKLFMCKWLAGKDSDANVFINRIRTSGKTIVEGDQFAAAFADDFLNGKINNQQKILFKARYATDGGFLTKAADLTETVSEKSFNSLKEKAEYNYRKGRILQKSGRTEQAISYYERVMEFTDNSASGFSASAALQLGYIYFEKSENPKAKTYFKKAISFKNHEYKNSIDNKARAALTDLGE
ncbi:tetratricopeptide repeat protein [Dyadobacter arcticus]|uniref:Outer membrane protein assembly factor BamD (BamD/ComL family) n=1 Tax=Dyadobacter arcticus TaxID=1078754 RepID=A0ABX0UGS4_9BACT|nr:tetratricopeptide repeat protein [Dyadobacter arcticus]NIJ52107.1 outer membrane protein assembly factor BamD (BamD/ComL family) [Dyadobacter arcticus]